MSEPLRTYSFRAPTELSARLDHVRPLFDDPRQCREIAWETERLLAYDGVGVLLGSGGQSALIRAVVELVLGAAETVADGLAWDVADNDASRTFEDDPEWLAAVLAVADAKDANAAA